MFDEGSSIALPSFLPSFERSDKAPIQGEGSPLKRSGEYGCSGTRRREGRGVEETGKSCNEQRYMYYYGTNKIVVLTVHLGQNKGIGFTRKDLPTLI